MACFQSQEFKQHLYQVIEQIPYGKVLSYGQVAALAGWPQHARAVGKTLSQLPTHLSLPCHRVVHANGALVPHWTQHRILLEKEGVSFTATGRVEMKKHRWQLNEQ